MNTLILHIPNLHEHLQKWKRQSGSFKRISNSVHEHTLSGTYAKTETFLTHTPEVLLANYRSDELTIYYTNEPQRQANIQFIHYLNEQGINYFPIKASLLLERRVKEKL